MENDPYVKMQREADSSALDEKQRKLLQQNLPMIMQDPNIPDLAKNMTKRLFFKANGFKPNQVNNMVPKGHHEDMAANYVRIINANEKPRSLFKNLPTKNPKKLKEALTTYYIYIQQAHDTDMKEEVLSKLRNTMNRLGMAIEGIEKA